MWVRLDDAVTQHPKLLDVGAEAAWLWVAGLAHCNRATTDGRIAKRHIPALYVPLKDRAKVLAARLVEVGLWLDRGDHFEVHDYAEYQEEALRSNVDERKIAARMRKRAERERKKLARSEVSHAVTPRDMSRVTSRDMERDIACDQPRDITRDGARDIPCDAPRDALEVSPALPTPEIPPSPQVPGALAAADFFSTSQPPGPSRPDPARPDPSPLAPLGGQARAGRVVPGGPELGLMPAKAPPIDDAPETRDLRECIELFEQAYERRVGRRLGLTVNAEWTRAANVWKWARKTRPEAPHELVREAAECACASDSFLKLGAPWAAFASQPGRNLRGPAKTQPAPTPTTDAEWDAQVKRFQKRGAS